MTALLIAISISSIEIGLLNLFLPNPKNLFIPFLKGRNSMILFRLSSIAISEPECKPNFDLKGLGIINWPLDYKTPFVFIINNQFMLNFSKITRLTC